MSPLETAGLKPKALTLRKERSAISDLQALKVTCGGTVGKFKPRTRMKSQVLMQEWKPKLCKTQPQVKRLKEASVRERPIT